MLRDYACMFHAEEILFKLPEYIGWLFLGVVLLYYMLKFTFTKKQIKTDDNYRGVTKFNKRKVICEKSIK